MDKKINSQLKKRVIAYFLEKYQVDISEKQAEQYLSSMADLYTALKNIAS